MGMSVISLSEGPGAEVLSDTKTLVQLVDNLPRIKGAPVCFAFIDLAGIV